MDYVEAFQNLKTINKYSRKSPHKAVLLLAIIDMFESRTLTDNIIRFDDILESVFVRIWNKVFPNETIFHSEAYLPFWFMQNEVFWHIVPLRGKEDILNILRDSHIKPSESKLRDCVDYVELDEDLYFLMTLQSGRSTLKRVLLETYTTLSTRTIDKFSESSDNFTDCSEDALNKYENIISSSIVNGSSTERKINIELKDRFFKLTEDIQYVLNIEYFSFLKKNINEREMFKEICPTVYDLYDKIAFSPIKQGEIYPSLSSTYENFLSNLRIALMSEDDSLELIDKINKAINHLNSLENTSHEDSFEYKDKTEDDVNIESNVSNITQNDFCPLKLNLESRQDKPWTKKDEELITAYYNQGYGFNAIATATGRTEVSIESRLESLGLLKHTNESDFDIPTIKDDKSDEKSDKVIVFNVENTALHCFVRNPMGKRVYSTTGKLKILHNNIYRFNYKASCFTVKKIITKDSNWIKSSKKLVAYPDSRLYSVLSCDNYLDLIEDFHEEEDVYNNKIKVDGLWFDFNGNLCSMDSPNNPDSKIHRVENIGNVGSILNTHGTTLYSSRGNLKILHDHIYRFKKKDFCLTVKKIQKINDVWIKSPTLLVAFSNTKLYKSLSSKNFIDSIEDFNEQKDYKENRIKVDGLWYNYEGNLLTNDNQSKPSYYNHNSSHDRKITNFQNVDRHKTGTFGSWTIESDTIAYRRFDKAISSFFRININEETVWFWNAEETCMPDSEHEKITIQIIYDNTIYRSILEYIDLNHRKTLVLWVNELIPALRSKYKKLNDLYLKFEKKSKKEYKLSIL